MIADFPWGQFYEAAILETDRSKLGERIQAAEQAIRARIQELNSDHGGSKPEQDAIRDALSGLKVLQKEIPQSVPAQDAGRGRIGPDTTKVTV